jgi:hypothetical protein
LPASTLGVQISIALSGRRDPLKIACVELGKVMVTRTSDKDDSETTEVHAVYKEELFYFLISYSSGASVSGCKGIIFNLE